MTTVPASAVDDVDLRSHPDRDISGDDRLVRVTVTATDRISPHLQRITLRGEGLVGMTLTGPDEYFGLLMPAPGTEVPVLSADGLNVRAAVAALDEAVRPQLRWYTVRNFRQATGEIDVDVVMHDDHPGPGARWVSAAAVGDHAAVWLCNAVWIRHATRPLFVADASAVPALRAVLEFVTDHHPEELPMAHVRVVAHDEGELEPGLVEEWGEQVGSLQVVYAEPGTEADAVCAVLRRDRAAGHPAAHPEYVWASGEAGMTKAVRGVAVKEWDVDRAHVDWIAYWIEGRPRP